MSDSGGQSSRELYSNFIPDQQRIIDPWAGLRDVLGRIETTPINRVVDLLPANWKAARVGR